MRTPIVREGLVLGGFVVLAVVMTWPLGRLSRAPLPDLHDSAFSVWRLAWVAHQLRADPVNLFDANIFYPEPNTLAYSDALMLPALLGTPLQWMGLHPFRVHNILLIAAFALAGYCAYRLGFKLTRSRGPAIVCGVINAFVPYRFGHIGHLELLWTAFMPLGVIALMRLMERPTIAAGLRLAACLVLQTLCSVYYGVYFALYLGPAALLSALDERRTLIGRRLAVLAVAAVASALLLLPYGLVYRDATRTVALRSAGEIARYSAVPADYLRVSRDNKLFAADPDGATEELALFPGVIAAALAAIGLASRSQLALLHGCLLLVCVDLSLGTNGVAYPLLLKAAPFLVGLRAPARFGALVSLELSVLAALGVTRVLAWVPSWRGWLAGALSLGLLAEYWSAPLQTREWPLEPPPVYRWLATQPAGVVLELPMPTPGTLWGMESEYAVMSIYHWRPLVNGYSGYASPGYLQRLEVMGEFPSAPALTLLRQLRVRWIIVHQRSMGDAAFTDLMYRSLATGTLRVAGTFPDDARRVAVLEFVPG